ncbi:MAG: alpha-ketoglutarate-dependent dioxygenase AlkB family protein [Hyphomicrobiales bacterium]
MAAELVSDGLRLIPGFLDRAAQERLRDAVAEVVAQAPLYQPVMPRSGRPFSVRMTNAGPLGWVSDRAGYRYQAHHPETGAPWPAMPSEALEAWRAVSGYGAEPECCLINVYAAARARMGLHRDEDEDDLAAPVVSISLGDTALFRIGGAERKGPTRSFRLASGDVLVLAGPSRHFYHGVDRVMPETSTLFPEGGRINLTMRRVRVPEEDRHAG